MLTMAGLGSQDDLSPEELDLGKAEEEGVGLGEGERGGLELECAAVSAEDNFLLSWSILSWSSCFHSSSLSCSFFFSLLVAQGGRTGKVKRYGTRTYTQICTCTQRYIHVLSQDKVSTCTIQYIGKD